MSTPITDISSFDAEYLESLLRSNGCLTQGSVVSLQNAGDYPGRGSTLDRFSVTYSSEIVDDLPGHLCLKRGHPDPNRKRNREVEFYNDVATRFDAPFLLRCYEAVYDAESGRSHLILEDVSETHSNDDEGWPVPLPMEQCEQAIDCLSDTHAFWWNHTELGQTIGEFRSESEEKQHWGYIEEILPRYLDFLGDRLSTDRRRIFDHVMSRRQEIVRRIAKIPKTVMHNDAHFWNFLYPRDKGTTIIFDWEGWHPGEAASDLAYMIALHWYPERRRIHEQSLIKRYHQRLTEQLEEDYAWQDLWNDYRLLVATKIFIPMWQWEHDGPAHRWWSHLERILLAYEDLHCAELLD